jgi:hypothetical protein
MLKVKKEIKEWAEPKQVMEPKAYEGPKLMDPYKQFSEAFDDLGERLERLERVVNKLTPFILKEQCPDLKQKAKVKCEE